MHDLARTLSMLLGAAVALSTAACDDGGSGSGSTGGSAGSGGGTGGGGGTGASPAGGTGGGGAAPGCGSLADAVRVSSLTVSAPAVSPHAVTAQRGDGSIVVWAGDDSKVHALPLDANDAMAGDEITVDGTRVFGAAATQDQIALLVARDPDFMTLHLVGPSGEQIASTDLVGGGDHAEIGVEWFGEFAQTGRLAVQTDGTYAAYHALHRRWPDDIGHQGDTLRLLGKDGQALGGGWDWGCSHSMDQRLASGPNGLVPVCIADCYPGKGVYFNHSAAQITEDPAANCAGGFSTALGGLVAVADGFFLVFGDAQGTAHLGHYGVDGKPISTQQITQPGSSRLALYEGGLLIGSPGGAGTTIEKLDAAGQPTGEKAEVGAAPPDQDFESRTDGEVAWVTASGATLTVVRVRECP